VDVGRSSHEEGQENKDPIRYFFLYPKLQIILDLEVVYAQCKRLGGIRGRWVEHIMTGGGRYQKCSAAVLIVECTLLHEGNRLGRLTEPEAVVADPLFTRVLALHAGNSQILKPLRRSQRLFPVRGSDAVLNGSARFGPTPNPDLDFWSGSAPTPNPGPNFGPVRSGSGPDRSSEPNRGNPTPLARFVPRHPCLTFHPPKELAK